MHNSFAINFFIMQLYKKTIEKNKHDTLFYNIFF